MECRVPCHISIYWVWDSVKQSEGWGKNPPLIARSPTRHSEHFIEKFHHKSSLLVWLPKVIGVPAATTAGYATKDYVGKSSSQTGVCVCV